MSKLFSYRDNQIYAHHTIDESPEPEQFAIHAHEWMEILYCISGRGSYMVEGVQYPLEPHDIFIIRPGELHKLNIDPGTPYERVAFHFDPEALSPFDPNGSLLHAFTERPLGSYNRYAINEDPGRLLRAPLTGLSHKGIPQIRLHLFARLIMFLTQLDGHFQVLQHKPDTESQNELISYVNKHLFDDISVQSAADAMHLSRSQVSRIFQQYTGTSMWKYVRIKRLLAARAMIQRGESANDACSACSFSDYSAFYRAYRSYFGHSPKEDAPK